jgi:hypothetical protein
MLGAVLLRSALSAFSTLFGSLGIFFLYLSFQQPGFAAQAILFLGSATAIVWSASPKGRRR